MVPIVNPADYCNIINAIIILLYLNIYNTVDTISYSISMNTDYWTSFNINSLEQNVSSIIVNVCSYIYCIHGLEDMEQLLLIIVHCMCVCVLEGTTSHSGDVDLLYRVQGGMLPQEG